MFCWGKISPFLMCLMSSFENCRSIFVGNLYSLSILKKVLNLLEEVFTIWVILVLDCHVEGLSEDGNHIGAIGSWHKIERDSQIFHKFVFALSCSLINVYLICDDNARDVRSMMSHFLVPALQVLVGYLAGGVKNKDGCWGSEIVRGMELVEGLLAGSVPYI